MNDIKFERQNGNVPKTLAGEDHISGYLAYVTTLPSGFTKAEPVKVVSTIDTAESLGVTSDAESWELKVLHYQLSEIFRINPGITLYVGLFSKPTGGSYTFSEVKQLQNYSGGKIRQVAVYLGDVEMSAEHLTALQGIATTLESEDVPLSILFAPKVTSVTDLSKDLAGANKKNVSVIIGQAGDGTGSTLFADTGNVSKNSVTGIGVVLGLLSLSAVHESIGWVKKFPTGIDLPAFSDGTLFRTLDRAVVESLDTARFLFFVTYSGLTGSYMNDSHTMDVAISDYAMIENVRTMDKAIRGIRTYLLPELGSNLYIDEATGKMQSYTVEHLQDVAGKALEDMAKAGEISGYSVEIDPEQNVLSSSNVEFVVKKVGVGVMRHARVKIGYVESLS